MRHSLSQTTIWQMYLKKHYCLTSKYLKNIVYNYADKVMTIDIEILSKLNWERYE